MQFYNAERNWPYLYFSFISDMGPIYIFHLYQAFFYFYFKLAVGQGASQL